MEKVCNLSHDKEPHIIGCIFVYQCTLDNTSIDVLLVVAQLSYSSLSLPEMNQEIRPFRDYEIPSQTSQIQYKNIFYLVSVFDKQLSLINCSYRDKLSSINMNFKSLGHRIKWLEYFDNQPNQGNQRSLVKMNNRLEIDFISTWIKPHIAMPT